MRRISYARHRFPPSIIQRAVWLYFRFPLSFRDVEEMLAERGIDVSYETIRRWILKFGPAIAASVRSRRVQPSGTWLGAPSCHGWSNKQSGGGFTSIARQRFVCKTKRRPTRRRERRMGRFKSPGSMQRFLSVHDAIYNHFNLQRHLISRQTLCQTRRDVRRMASNSGCLIWGSVGYFGSTELTRQSPRKQAASMPAERRSVQQRPFEVTSAISPSRCALRWKLWALFWPDGAFRRT